jgi:hypothetical protein
MVEGVPPLNVPPAGGAAPPATPGSDDPGRTPGPG